MAEEARSPYGSGWYRMPGFIFDDCGAVGVQGVAVYAALASFADGHGECWPSLGAIARRVGASRPTVIKALRRLESVGLIRIARPGEGAAGHHSNLYTLLPCPEGAPLAARPAAPEGRAGRKDAPAPPVRPADGDDQPAAPSVGSVLISGHQSPSSGLEALAGSSHPHRDRLKALVRNYAPRLRRTPSVKPADGDDDPPAPPVNLVDGDGQNALPHTVKGVDRADDLTALSVKSVDSGDHRAAPAVKPVDGEGQEALPPSVKSVDGGGKRALPELDLINKTQFIPAAAAAAGIDLVRVKAVDQAVAAFNRRFYAVTGEAPLAEIAGLAGRLYDRGTPEWWDLTLDEAERKGARHLSYVCAVVQGALRAGRPPGGRPGARASPREGARRRVFPSGGVPSRERSRTGPVLRRSRRCCASGRPVRR